MKIVLPKTEKEYLDAIRSADRRECLGTIISLFLFISTVTLWMGVLGFGEQPLPRMDWALYFTAALTLSILWTGKYVLRHHDAKKKMVGDLREVIKASGFYDFPDRDAYVAQLRKAVFEGNVNRIFELHEEEVSRWKIIADLEETIKFSEDRDWHKLHRYTHIFRENINPLDMYKMRMGWGMDGFYVNSPDLMEKVWRNATAAQRESWWRFAVSNNFHAVCRVFPKQEFYKFVAGKGKP